MNSFDYMAWVVIPLLIFCARLIDVSLATLRHIFIFRGMRRIVPFIAFVEVLIWLVAITQVMQNLSNVAGYLGWALGFAAGTHLGMVLEEKMALGHQLLRIITQENSSPLLEILHEQQFRYTRVPAMGARGPVDILFVAVKRKRLPKLLSALKACDPHLFYTIEDVRSVTAGGGNPPLPTGVPSMSRKRK